MNHFEIYLNNERAGAFTTQVAFEAALKKAIAQYGAAAISTNSAQHNK
jgi:hypothetical protein